MRSQSYLGITWYDNPTRHQRDIRSLERKFGFHELDIEDCLSEHERPKIEEYENYLFLVFHIPYLSQKTKRVMKEEVNIFLAQDFIITLHEGKIPILDVLWNKLKFSKEAKKEFLSQGTGFFLYELMRSFFEDTFPIVDKFYRSLRNLENSLFSNEEENNLLREIMDLKRNIITMRSILLPQRTLIATLEHKNKKFVSEELALYFDDILDAIERLWSLLETAKEMTDSLQETHESWLSQKTNSIIRVLTIFSVTMLPLTFLTGLYGMNVGLPFQNHPFAFLGIIVAMVSLIIGMIAYFWKKRWI